MRAVRSPPGSAQPKCLRTWRPISRAGRSWRKTREFSPSNTGGEGTAMFPRAYSLSRRQILTGAAATTAYGRWLASAHAETTADGTHVLRARVGATTTQGEARSELLGY